MQITFHQVPCASLRLNRTVEMLQLHSGDIVSCSWWMDLILMSLQRKITKRHTSRSITFVNDDTFKHNVHELSTCTKLPTIFMKYRSISRQSYHTKNINHAGIRTRRTQRMESAAPTIEAYGTSNSLCVSFEINATTAVDLSFIIGRPRLQSCKSSTWVILGKNLEVLKIQFFFASWSFKNRRSKFVSHKFHDQIKQRMTSQTPTRESSTISKSIQQQTNRSQRSIRTRTRELSVSQQIALNRFAVWTDWIKQETMSRAFPHNHTISDYLQVVLDIQHTQEPYDDDDNRIRPQKLNDLSWNYPARLRYTNEIHGEWILQSDRR